MHRANVTSGRLPGMRSIGPVDQVATSLSAFARFRFPPEVILLAVRWYLRLFEGLSMNCRRSGTRRVRYEMRCGTAT